MSTNSFTPLQASVLRWYEKNGRHSLPWRNVADLGVDPGYGVMVSEFMLQQTQVERVIPKYTAFLKRFPTVESLASASVSDVIALWSGLGYNRRAVLLHRAAQTIHTLYSDDVPHGIDTLKSIPGIGPYTAGAIAAFSYNEPVAMVDTNIERFYELLFWGYEKPSVKEVATFAQSYVPSACSRAWHSAIMDLMTCVRKRRTPLEQQQSLLEELAFIPRWTLPLLGSKPFARPKQSSFVGSRRSFRGRIIAYLTSCENHQASLSQVGDILPSDMPYKLEELIEGLVKDGLLTILPGSTEPILSLSPQ
ncbi:MAG TPA: A/G-specific adenine glycosylase [Patescibacteria group bacterium]